MTTRAEFTRRASNKAKILAALRLRPHTNFELFAIGGVRAGARVFELRRQGYRIRTERISDAECRYVLEPDGRLF